MVSTGGSHTDDARLNMSVTHGRNGNCKCPKHQATRGMSDAELAEHERKRRRADDRARYRRKIGREPRGYTRRE